MFIESVLEIANMVFKPLKDLKKPTYKKLEIWNQGWETIDIDTPPTGNLTSLNLTWSFTCRPLLKNETVKVVLDAVVNGSFGNISSVAGSTLAGLTKFKACGSAVKGLG